MRPSTWPEILWIETNGEYAVPVGVFHGFVTIFDGVFNYSASGNLK